MEGYKSLSRGLRLKPEGHILLSRGSRAGVSVTVGA